MSGIDEQFGAALVRVIKKVKRRTPDGGVRLVRQAFHVKKAAPDDEYSSKAKTGVPPMHKASVSIQAQPMPQSAGDVDSAQQQSIEVVIPQRVAVRYHDIPWTKKKTKSSAEREDPVPAEIRLKYDKSNRSMQVTNPVANESPTVSVMPTDRILWGVDEPLLLGDLRSGFVRKMVLVKPRSGMILSKIESQRGGTYSAYIWLESLREPVLKSIWGDLVDLESGGALSRRAAASYEVAKTCGLDDIVPPTVHRFDDAGDLVSVLPDDLIENRDVLVDWIARETGSNVDDVRKEIGGHVTVQLVRDRLWTVDEEDWFKAIFDGPDESNVLNTPWENLPDDRRISFLRMAVFDFLVWNMDRSIGDIAFCDNPKHPVVSYGNEMTIPCARALGVRYGESGAGAYGDMPVSPAQARPILWNDVLSMLSIRGGDAEINVYEQIGQDVASRMRGDRPVELVRSLLDRGLTLSQIGGVLSRIWMLATHSKDIARDPYFAPRYYASVVAGNAAKNLAGFAEFVDRVIGEATLGKFSFSSELRGKKNA